MTREHSIVWNPAYIGWNPAYDKRNPDPSKNYGVHGVTMRWYVKGPEGVVQFVVYANWMPPETEIIHKDFLCRPMAADIGYHSPTPRYEEHEPFLCDLLPEGKCYYDGSSLWAERYLGALISEGGDAVWEMLEKYYDDTFC